MSGDAVPPDKSARVGFIFMENDILTNVIEIDIINIRIINSEEK